MDRLRALAAPAVAAAALALAGCAAPTIGMVPDPGSTPWTVMTPGPIDMGPEGDPAPVLAAQAPGMCGAPSGTLEDGVLPAVRATSAATISPQGTAQPISLAEEIRIADRGDEGERFIVFGEAENVVIGAAAAFECTWRGEPDLERIAAWSPELAPLGVIELRPLDSRGAPRVTGLRIEREIVHATWDVLRADGTTATQLEADFRWDGTAFQPERLEEQVA